MGKTVTSCNDVIIITILITLLLFLKHAEHIIKLDINPWDVFNYRTFSVVNVKTDNRDYMYLQLINLFYFDNSSISRLSQFNIILLSCTAST